jgi:hypothetical protein
VGVGWKYRCCRRRLLDDLAKPLLAQRAGVAFLGPLRDAVEAKFVLTAREAAHDLAYFAQANAALVLLLLLLLSLCCSLVAAFRSRQHRRLWRALGH